MPSVITLGQDAIEGPGISCGERHPVQPHGDGAVLVREPEMCAIITSSMLATMSL
jgi:hypothetical protein